MRKSILTLAALLLAGTVWANPANACTPSESVAQAQAQLKQAYKTDMTMYNSMTAALVKDLAKDLAAAKASEQKALAAVPKGLDNSGEAMNKIVVAYNKQVATLKQNYTTDCAFWLNWYNQSTKQAQADYNAALCLN